MPQMAPALWAPLFLFILVTLTLILSFSYFTDTRELNKLSVIPTFNKKINWLW